MYPLLEHLSPGVKIIFFAAVTVIINVFYLMGEVLNNYIWDTQKCEYCFGILSREIHHQDLSMFF